MVSARQDHSQTGEGSHSSLKVRPEAESREVQRSLGNFIRTGFLKLSELESQGSSEVWWVAMGRSLGTELGN